MMSKADGEKVLELIRLDAWERYMLDFMRRWAVEMDQARPDHARRITAIRLVGSTSPRWGFEIDTWKAGRESTTRFPLYGNSEFYAEDGTQLRADSWIASQILMEAHEG
jgi:hypothetical protein